MIRRIIICTLVLVSMLFVACENTNDKETNIKIIYDNKYIVLSDEKYESFICSVEKIVTDNCIRGLELQQVISEQRIDEYSSNGGYIQIDFNVPYECELKSIKNDNNISLQVNQVFFLIDSDKNNSLIGILSDNSAYVYPMSNQSVDTIKSYWT